MADTLISAIFVTGIYGIRDITTPPPPLMGPQACKKRYYKTVDNADISFEDQLSNVELIKVPLFVFHQKLLPQTAQFHL